MATEVVRQGYLKAYPGIAPEKFVCIPNGFDPEDISSAKENKHLENRDFSISYLGEFYFGRTPEVFLSAVSELIELGLIPGDRLKLRFIGNVRYFGRKALEDVISEIGLSDVTEIIDPVPYFKAIEYMVESKVLLVFSPQPFFQPTKVFEYMASGAFVIAFTPPGALAGLVSQYPKGIVVDYHDVEGAKKAVMFCYDRFLKREGTPEPDNSKMEKSIEVYERKHLTKRLSAYL